VTGRQGAPQRHPSGNWQPDLERMTAKMAAQLGAEGHPWPQKAARLLADRGRLGLDRAAYAAEIGMDLALLVAIEDGSAIGDWAVTRVGHPEGWGET
jgi:hypothetical protein